MLVRCTTRRDHKIKSLTLLKTWLTLTNGSVRERNLGLLVKDKRLLPSGLVFMSHSWSSLHGFVSVEAFKILPSESKVNSKSTNKIKKAQ